MLQCEVVESTKHNFQNTPVILQALELPHVEIKTVLKELE